MAEASGWDRESRSSGIWAVVLAAGAGSRFGGGKLLERLAGKPILQHVLDTLAAADVDHVVVVVGADADAIESTMEWRTERRVRNPDPASGLASSLRIGIGAVPSGARGGLILLGDQPLVSADTLRELIGALDDSDRPIIAPRYGDDRGRNPVLLRADGFQLVEDATGDHGLGPVIARRPELVHEIDVSGANPDVDTQDDLAGLVEAGWAERVRANRAQVDQVREVPDGTDFYAPVRSMFRADPLRTDDPVLQILLTLARPGDTWLDIGAGAGRFALPIAIAVREGGGAVIALDPSVSMLEAAREIAAEHGIDNVTTVEARWPPDAPDRFKADVALIAHVGYDIEAIGPFLSAMERAADRECVAVLMDQMPASAADAFWPLVHGMARVPLPALSDFVELLQARGRGTDIQRVTDARRSFESRSALEAFVRRQLWIDPAGPKEILLQSALDELAEPTEVGWTIRGRGPVDIGVVRWSVAGRQT